MKKKPWDENWEIIDTDFGGGGQGTTHLVKSRDERVGKAILKILKYQKSPKARLRMHHEVLNLGVVVDAGGKVPRVLESNTEAHKDKSVPLYFVMEFISGETLESHVQRNKKLSLDKSLRIVRGIASTVQIAHQYDVIHRDLKPKNILIGDSGVFVVDYGLSFNRQSGVEVTETGESIGNRFLALPEFNVVGGDRRDARSELTLLCGLLCFCLTGQEPRQLRDQDERPPHQRSRMEDIPDDARLPRLELLFDRGFDLNINNRFQSLDELLNELDKLSDPQAKTLVEEPREAAQRLILQLQERSRPMQLDAYKPMAVKVVQALAEVFNPLSNEIEKLQFSSQTVTGDLELPPGHDPIIESFNYQVTVNLFPQKVGCEYTVCAQGEVSVVLRRRGSYETNGSLVNRGTWVEVCSYPAMNEPPLRLIQDDFKRTMNSMMEELGNLIDQE